MQNSQPSDFVNNLLLRCNVDPSFDERMATFYAQRHLYDQTEEDEPGQDYEDQTDCEDLISFANSVASTSFKLQNLKIIDQKPVA